MKDREKPGKFLLPHGMPSDDGEFAFSSRVFHKASKIKAPYKSRNYQFISFLEHLVSEVSGKIIVFADRHPAHEAKAVEAWLEGRESQIELEERLPRYSPEYNADEFLNNDLKQMLENEPMPQSTSAFRETICGILE
jgi:hypothetical protein